MTMGETGMADMGEMGMKVPRNSVPMVGAPGPHDYITMGGMFTILKVRGQLTDGQDVGWYKNPPETVAATASNADLRADAITVPRQAGDGKHQPTAHRNKMHM